MLHQLIPVKAGVNSWAGHYFVIAAMTMSSCTTMVQNRTTVSEGFAPLCMSESGLLLPE